jgi:tRNA threonylcarbamoyl adenosine modification protein YeaZ
MKMFLCIDTTTSEAGITLINPITAGEDHDPRLRIAINPYHASNDILKKIDQLIQKANIKLSDIKGVFVIKGPGSFTGLRVGIAVANQFAHQLKIPIVGLRTDEWWRNRTYEKDFVYLQSMNKSEVYYSKNGQASIKSIDGLSGKTKWLGELLDEHHQKLPSGFKEITDLRPPDETWEIVIKTSNVQRTKTYELVEPYYGKEPTITKSKKKLSID